MKYDQDSLKQMDKRHRARFINSVIGTKPALMVGSQNAHGQSNLAIMSSAFHLGADPALIGLIIRPSESPRHTFNNILETGCFTLNHITADIVEAAHQTSARYPEGECEFDAVGLEKEYLNGFTAPFVAQAPIKLGVTLVEHQLLAVNKTHLIIGEIQLLDVPENAVNHDGFVDIIATGTVAVTGLDHYVQPTSLKRLSYAKVDRWPEEIQ
ncbi:flavin reductase family protein [Aurantivibrio plasticivorans]